MQFGARALDLNSPKVMGILNITPDSFFDGGRLYASGALLDQALAQAERMVTEGADILDVGGESTRPGASPVPAQEELDRVIPVVEAIAQRLDVVISVDTSTPEVIRSAAEAGAGLINDVRALARPGALEAVAATDLPVCLMHTPGEPDTMQRLTRYDDVVTAVIEHLRERMAAAQAAGIGKDRLLVDPGIGFGKTPPQNLRLLHHIGKLCGLAPVLIGVSRKSLFGHLLGRPASERLAASVATALLAVERGAAIVRVHDVAATVDALRMRAYVAAADQSVD